MITVREAGRRGHADYGWLNTYHSFSFGSYYDPKHVRFRALRVINEDRVQPGHGFGSHPHQDMEIVSYVVEGGLAHQDSMGNGSVIRAGELQRMSAGTGVTHSEHNASDSETVHFYQIWIVPRQSGLAPSYEQKIFDPAERSNRFQLVVSPDGAAGSLTIHQDARIYLADPTPEGELRHRLESDRFAWLQVLRGNVRVNGETLGTSDGARIEDERDLILESEGDSQVMLLDLA